MSDEGLYPVTDDLGMAATVRGFIGGQRLFDRYVLRRVLGRGGMGVVWQAHDEHLERDVALKFLPELITLDKEAISDLKRETRRSLELTHAHIVRIYDFVQDKSWAGISMEYIEGDTLSAYKVDQPNSHFEVETLRPWIVQLCDALEYAHTKAKVVHRDLKPANLMINSARDLKVADFGIARSVSDSVSRVTMHGGSGGTLVYMSPQQAQGRPQKVTDDVYSLGATLYDLLSGKPPFYSGNIQHQLETITPDPILERREHLGLAGEEVPAEWEATIAACLAKDPAQRPQSIAEVAERLGLRTATATHAASRPATAPTVEIPPSEPPPPKPSRKGWLISLSVAVVVLVLGVVGYYYGIATPAEKARRAEIAQQEADAKAAAAEAEKQKADAAVAQAAAQAKTEQEKAALEKTKQEADARAAAAEKAAQQAKADAEKAKQAEQAAPVAKVAIDNAEAAGYRVKATAGDVEAARKLGLLYLKGQGVTRDATEGMKWMKMAGDKGDAQAQNILGEAYLNGNGVKEDDTQALSWFQKAADQGLAEAQVNLGRMYTGAYLVAENNAQVLSWYQKAADQGNADAQLSMGNVYSSGAGGVTKDEAQAQAWYKEALAGHQKAANEGNVKAQYSLADMYSLGLGVMKDEAQAKSWYQKALSGYQKLADQGDPEAQWQVGYMYDCGIGVPMDYSQGLIWYHKAADQGYPFAAGNLGYAYQTGDGVAQDSNKAIEWYKKAAELGQTNRWGWIGEIYDYGIGLPKEYSQALLWYQKADAANPNIPYMNLSGNIYLKGGYGVTQEYGQALICFQKAADKDEFGSQEKLGEMYEHGWGVTKDIPNAIQWYKKAAAKNDSEAQAALKRLGH